VPLARDRRLSEGRPEVVLRATRGVRNNIPYRNGAINYTKKSHNQRLFGIAILLPLNLIFIPYKAYN